MDMQASYYDLVARLERAVDVWRGYEEYWTEEERVEMARVMREQFELELNWWKSWIEQPDWDFAGEYPSALALRIAPLVRQVCEPVIEQTPLGDSPDKQLRHLACARLLYILNSINTELHGGEQ